MTKAIYARLPCEQCGKLHIDEGEFATKLHHTHACQYCGAVWRPMREHSFGVQFLPGFRGEEPPRPHHGDCPWPECFCNCMYDPQSKELLSREVQSARLARHTFFLSMPRFPLKVSGS